MKRVMGVRRCYTPADVLLYNIAVCMIGDLNIEFKRRLGDYMADIYIPSKRVVIDLQQLGKRARSFARDSIENKYQVKIYSMKENIETFSGYYMFSDSEVEVPKLTNQTYNTCFDSYVKAIKDWGLGSNISSLNALKNKGYSFLLDTAKKLQYSVSLKRWFDSTGLSSKFSFMPCAMSFSVYDTIEYDDIDAEVVITCKHGHKKVIKVCDITEDYKCEECVRLSNSIYDCAYNSYLCVPAMRCMTGASLSELGDEIVVYHCPFCGSEVELSVEDLACSTEPLCSCMDGNPVSITVFGLVDDGRVFYCVDVDDISYLVVSNGVDMMLSDYVDAGGIIGKLDKSLFSTRLGGYDNYVSYMNSLIYIPLSPEFSYKDYNTDMKSKVSALNRLMEQRKCIRESGAEDRCVVSSEYCE